MSQTDPLPDRGGSVREDGGYVGKCTGCYRWYWNYWGAGTYCPDCTRGYCETLRGHWDAAEGRAEELQVALEDLLNWAENIEGEGRLRRTEALVQARVALGGPLERLNTPEIRAVLDGATSDEKGQTS